MRRASQVLGTLLASAITVACFRGAERDKEAPAGLPGGLCLAPEGTCDDGALCDRDRNFCYDAGDPCNGFFCGGEERGTCSVDENMQPACTCAPGYNNGQFELYCCPDAGSGIVDPKCAADAG